MLDSWSGVGDMPMGAVQTWGMYNCEGTADDWFRSDYIVVWIGNPAYTRIPDDPLHARGALPRREARGDRARLQRHARSTPTCGSTSEARDRRGARARRRAQVIVSEDLYDADYVREQTDLPFLVREDTRRFLREADLRRRRPRRRLLLLGRGDGRARSRAGLPGRGDGDARSRSASCVPRSTGRFTVTAGGRRRRSRCGPSSSGCASSSPSTRPRRPPPITGVAPAVIRRFAHELAAAKTAMIFASWGACKHHHSDLFQRAMILLMALTGNQGKPGGGLRVAAWWGLDGLDKMATARRRAAATCCGCSPRPSAGSRRATTSSSSPSTARRQPNTPLMPFLYVHGGYREMWSRPDLHDPALPRGIDEYMQLADRARLDEDPPAARPPAARLHLHRLEPAAALARAADRARSTCGRSST